jgi:hypothetical protein
MEFMVAAKQTTVHIIREPALRVKLGFLTAVGNGGIMKAMRASTLPNRFIFASSFSFNGRLALREQFVRELGVRRWRCARPVVYAAR